MINMIFPQMLKFILIIFVIETVLSLPNRASYIKANNRPLNIAHRGLSSILPENTLQAFEAALYQGADFVELDVVYTKQKYPLVMHDPFLTRITNLKQKPQFNTRYSTRMYKGQNKTDFWTDNFTLAQLKTLGIKQDQAPGRITIFDYSFTFPTLGEVIQMVIKFNEQHKGKRNPDGRLGGILIQAKDSQMYRDLYGLQIGQTILQTLKQYNVSTIEQAQRKCPIYLHSFDFGTVKYWAQYTELLRNYLLTRTMPYDLAQINKYANGIGYQDFMVWDYFLSTPTWILEETRKYQLLIHVWTFKDDARIFQSLNNIQMYKIGQIDMKLDGIITQSPDTYAPISQLLRAKQQKMNKKLQQNNILQHL